VVEGGFRCFYFVEILFVCFSLRYLIQLLHRHLSGKKIRNNVVVAQWASVVASDNPPHGVDNLIRSIAAAVVSRRALSATTKQGEKI